MQCVDYYVYKLIYKVSYMYILYFVYNIVCKMQKLIQIYRWIYMYCFYLFVYVFILFLYVIGFLKVNIFIKKLIYIVCMYKYILIN